MADAIEGLNLEQLHEFTAKLFFTLSTELAKRSWRPIEEAPKDQKQIVGWFDKDGNWQFCIADWGQFPRCWHVMGVRVVPSHYLPIFPPSK